MSKSEEMEGVIKKIIKEKRFGFIKVENIDRDIFFRFNDVNNEKLLKENARVSFKLEKNEKGYVAKKIYVLNGEKKGKYEKYQYLKNYIDNILKKTEVSNFNLKLNKYPYAKFIVEDEKTIKDIELKLDKVPNLNKFSFGDLYYKFISKYISTIKNLEDNSYLIREELFKPEYKLIIGLGNPSIYEVSMTLHHIYGIPYIPGQAIKGVLRNYVINTFFDLNEKERLGIAKEILNKELKSLEELDKEKDGLKVYKKIAEQKEKEALRNELFKFIFGSQDNQGNIVFFDAFPDGKINIDIDIMNNHFPEYYEDKESKVPPADWQNPRPIKFLIVKDTSFKFFIGMKKGLNIPNNLKKFSAEEPITTKEQLLNYVIELLKEALELSGIGAKTSIGYGYFTY